MDDRYELPIVDPVFENGYLRWQLQELLDESVSFVQKAKWSLPLENSYLRDMFDWECAPIKPVSLWDVKPFPILDAKNANPFDLDRALRELVRRLQELNHRFCFVSHLSDRRFYSLIVRGVLSCSMKQLKRPRSPICWNFCSFAEKGEVSMESNWLVYYASESERQLWTNRTGKIAPPHKQPLYRRDYVAGADVVLF